MILKANIKMFIKWIWTKGFDREESDFEQTVNCFPLLHLGLFTGNLEPLPDKGWRTSLPPWEVHRKREEEGQYFTKHGKKTAKIKITCRSKRGWDHEPAQGAWKPPHWARQQKWKPGNRASRQSDKKNKARSSRDKIHRKSWPGLILGIRAQGT